MHYLHNKEEDSMIKNKGLKVMFSIIVTLVTFFVGSALAERVARDNKGEGYVFIGGSVKEIIVSESVVEENRKLIGWERKKREPIETKLRRLMKKEEMIQNDYIKQRQELERIKKEQEWRQEQERRQEQEEMQEQEKRQEQERIKKEDWFR
jgi:membrane protein involved in colicin uptake